jgi:hypothetical protein
MKPPLFRRASKLFLKVSDKFKYGVEFFRFNL